VLTFHRCINYGSYWQARCLLEGLRARGLDAYLLDYCDAKSSVAEYRVALRPTLPTPVPEEDRKLYASKARRFLAEIERLPLSCPFPLREPEAMDPFDTVVIGSDEVWNLHHPWFGGCPAFWGMGLNARSVISYAASFGNYSCWDGIGSPWTDLLGEFDAISVRDENSWWMLKNALGLEAPLVLDPALQFPVRPAGSWAGLSESYALVYGHNFSSSFAKRIRKWADRRGLSLLSIGYRNDWADLQWLNADPHEFAHAMAHAEAVATNFFHGCVFALRNDRPFACELTEYRSIKVRGLLEHLEGKAHLVSGEASYATFENLLNQPYASGIRSRIRKARRQSNAYLSSALAQRHVT